MTVEIVLLAMIALFVGLRLYSVLGQRTGHEQRPVTRPEVPSGLRALFSTVPSGLGASPTDSPAAQGARQRVAEREAHVADRHARTAWFVLELVDGKARPDEKVLERTRLPRRGHLRPLVILRNAVTVEYDGRR